MGNNAKYLELDNNAVSNPLYCLNTMESVGRTDCVVESILNIDQLDKLDHLWHPPISSDNHATTPDQLKIPNADIIATLGYDIPKSLIESNTTEQKLRYENDLQTTPMKKMTEHIMKDVADAAGLTVLNSDRRVIDNSGYDTPKKRHKSYVDMSAIGRISHIGYNLDAKTFTEKKLSKELSFRFSSLINLSEQINI